MLQFRLWRRWREAFNLVVAISESVKHQLIKEGIEPIEVVWNGVRYHPLRPPLSLPPSVAFAGRLVREKGVDVLLHAFAKIVSTVPEAQLVIFGDGPEREYIAKLLIDLRLAARVLVFGHLPQSEMELKINTAWVQAVPSRWAEPFGIVAAEAMMRGTAVVASSSGGLAEIIQHGENGFLVPPDNVEALAKTLLRLLQNRELAEKMGRAGRQTALRLLHEETYVDRIIQLYETLSGRCPSNGR
jgi:glycosyltransferase involved in cell wall biosynthesis